MGPFFMLCIIKGCDKEQYCSFLCSTHYNRVRTTGNVGPSKYSRADMEERFWRQVDKKSDDECWNWKNSVMSTGYAKITTGGRNGKQIGAHRYSWELHNGPIPKGSGKHGTVVMHTCDNRKCVNPKHLRLGTQKDNVDDMDVKQRRINAQPAGQKHGNAKFTDDQVREIRVSPLNNAELGRIYGVPRQTIRYLRKSGWKHIGEA